MKNGRPAIYLVLIGIALQLSGCATTGAGSATGDATAGAGATTEADTAYDLRTAGTLVDDGLIEFKAGRALRASERLWEQSHINVTSYNNVVLISGETPSAELKAEAASIVSRVPKVREVHNELIVAAPSSYMSRSSDTFITGKVKSKMFATEDFPTARVKVVTENGTVFLLGLLTRSKADAATDITRRIGGVQRVVRLFEYVD